MSCLICHIQVKATGYVERHFALAENDVVEITRRDGKTFVGASAEVAQLPNSNWLFQVTGVTKQAVVLQLNPERYLDHSALAVALGESAVVIGNNNEQLELHVTKIAPPLWITNQEPEK